MSAGDPNTEAPTEQIANSASGKATSADSANTSAPEESGVEKKKKKGIIGKALDFMPAWAWILSFGLIMAIIAAIIAVTAMNSTEVGKGGANSKPSQVTPNYPEATTSGTWTQSRPAEPEPYYYDPGYQPDYNYAPEAPTSEESATESSSKPSSEPRPSAAPRPRPSTRPQPERPQPAPPNNGGSPNPPGGNGGNGGNGNTPGGNGGNGGAPGGNGGNGGNNGVGEAPLNPPSAPGN